MTELSKLDLTEMYRYMVLARRFDEVFIEHYLEGKGAVELPHSHIGQEAIGVGACYGLGRSDCIVPSLRTRPALFVRGVSAKEMMAGIFGKATGPARSKVTTHHIGRNDLGIIGSTGCIGSQPPVAAGVALASKIRKTNSVVLCFLGDGATSRGDFHEALNFSAVKRLPIIYFVENNQYAMWSRASSDVAIENIADRAAGYGSPGIVVDGNDVLAVHRAAQTGVERARKGEGLTLIECKTYRIRGHTERVLEHRPQEEINQWMARDPIKRFEEKLLEEGVINKEAIGKIWMEVDAELAEAVEFAKNSPFPDEEEVFKDVYATEFPSETYKEPELGHARELSIGAALNEGLKEEMTNDENIILIGEDLGANGVGTIGGLWPPTHGLCKEFPDRVIGAPISESLIVGAGVGAALKGMRPVVELQFSDFIAIAMDQIVNTAAK